MWHSCPSLSPSEYSILNHGHNSTAGTSVRPATSHPQHLPQHSSSSLHHHHHHHHLHHLHHNAGGHQALPPGNTDEYVDILQVQQLLLDSSTAPASVSSTCAPQPAALLPSRPRPRVNVQKAIEYQGKNAHTSSFHIHFYTLDRSGGCQQHYRNITTYAGALSSHMEKYRIICTSCDTRELNHDTFGHRKVHNEDSALPAVQHCARARR